MVEEALSADVAIAFSYPSFAELRPSLAPVTWQYLARFNE
jgi:hypothetical protein